MPPTVRERKGASKSKERPSLETRDADAQVPDFLESEVRRRRMEIMASGLLRRSTMSLALVLPSSSALCKEVPPYERPCKAQGVFDTKMSPDGKCVVGFTGPRAAPDSEGPDDDDSGPLCFVWAVSAQFHPNLR
jgi:hypothetical protein